MLAETLLAIIQSYVQPHRFGELLDGHFDDLTINDVKTVITFPATWGESAKDILTQAAFQVQVHVYPFGNRAFVRISKYRGGVGKIEKKILI